MATELPRQFTPHQLALSQEILQGRLLLSEMARLADLLTNLGDYVEVNLSFTQTSNGTAQINGGISLIAQVLCQRCLNPVKMAINAPIQLAYVHLGSGSDCTECYEVVQYDGSPVMTNEFIQDEIIIALPDHPKHPEGECQTDGAFGVGENRTHPFAVLAQFKP